MLCYIQLVALDLVMTLHPTVVVVLFVRPAVAIGVVNFYVVREIDAAEPEGGSVRLTDVGGGGRVYHCCSCLHVQGHSC